MTFIHVPGSKSIAARALICDFLGGGTCVLSNLPSCDDTVAMGRVLDAIGASRTDEEKVTVDVCEGGTTLRFALAVAASLPGTNVVLTGSRRLMDRPITPLVEALRNAGADITETETSRGVRGWYVRGYLLRSTLEEGMMQVSSQFGSALLLSAPARDGDFTLRVGNDTVSLPYLDMTVRVIEAMGGAVSGDSASGEICVCGTGYRLPGSYAIEPDWSGASYFYEADRVLRYAGYDVPRWRFSPAMAEDSLQGDARIATLVEEFDDLIRRATRGVRKWLGAPTWHVDCADTPDLVPALVAMACGCGVKFEITGVSNLRHKESDRLTVLAEALGTLGFDLHTGDDSLSWDGTRREATVTEEGIVAINPHGDHRMAMALAPLAACGHSLRIADAHCVSKSFPGFWEQLPALGYVVTAVDDDVIISLEDA